MLKQDSTQTGKTQIKANTQKLQQKKTANAKEAWITERGTSFGYGRLVNDFTGMLDNISYLGKNFVYDVTHSVQLPGSQGTATGGNRDYVPGLCRAGAALGIESFFIEVHPDPDKGLSDGPNMVPIHRVEPLIKQLLEIRKITLVRLLLNIKILIN